MRLIEINGNRVITKSSPTILADHIKVFGMTKTRQYENSDKN